MRIGSDYGIRNVGLLAMRFLRIERFIPFWGDELNADTNPFETNKGGKVMLNKPKEFIGKDAITKIKERCDLDLKLILSFNLNLNININHILNPDINLNFIF